MKNFWAIIALLFSIKSKMKYKYVLIFCIRTIVLSIFLSVCMPAHSGYSVQTYSENKDNDLMKMYVFGVAIGYLNANLYARGTSAGPMFCQNLKNGLILSKLKLEDFLKILENEISKTNAQLYKDVNIEKLLLQGMLNELPCTN